MRASEALMLGSAMLRPKRGVFYRNGMGKEDSEGCAMGMIAIANDPVCMDVPYWMSNPVNTELPCDCKGPMVMGDSGRMLPLSRMTTSVRAVVVHLFNEHVCDGSWSIERLADWLRTVEPREEPTPVVEEFPAHEMKGAER